MRTLETPIVNLNGSPRDMLVKQVWGVCVALAAAEQAIAQAMPHGRDYPNDAEMPRGIDAREAFAERARVIHAMQREFEALTLAINKQGR